MKFGVVIFPGSNCDHDMIYTFRDILQQEVVELWHKDHNLKNVDGILLPGGFSYGDYLRCGALAKFSPIMYEVMEFAGRGGFVMGVCNGFQILCESGLLPGVLLPNSNQQFICKNVYLLPDSKAAYVTRFLNKSHPLKIPIAHADGRYHADAKTLTMLQKNNQVLFRYCDAHGNVSELANPNGSVNNIAGICNVGRNVYGMMPHPERAADVELGNTDGLPIFRSILKMLA
ncbi:MAG: phosphoribosylformylglycinamidine synthase subunit PurQ [Prevotellaceae bacterium]|jgi:phosphoribosylformylglycinamidine synthase|nr:phosphoribosylformylglycinamidine synthase subunit PurQ [Prevotellaceae bacterium]